MLLKSVVSMTAANSSKYYFDVENEHGYSYDNFVLDYTEDIENTKHKILKKLALCDAKATVYMISTDKHGAIIFHIRVNQENYRQALEHYYAEFGS